MTDTAIIGGTGFTRLAGLQVERREVATTPFGDPSGRLVFGRLGDHMSGRRWVFLPRHGEAHRIPPHRVNYRANLWALKEAGVKRVIAFAAVGGIAAALTPGAIVIPDQIIDYTWGRQHTFFDGPSAAAASRNQARPDDAHDPLTHIDFGQPYSAALREKIIGAAKKAGVDLVVGATYAVTQGPRLETAAEINRLERDGADLVGMTAMPEAALARELNIQYATIAIVVNPAAGRSQHPISMQTIKNHLTPATQKALAIVKNW